MLVRGRNPKKKKKKKKRMGDGEWRGGRVWRWLAD
jgi:hypothetical protein